MAEFGTLDSPPFFPPTNSLMMKAEEQQRETMMMGRRRRRRREAAANFDGPENIHIRMIVGSVNKSLPHPVIPPNKFYYQVHIYNLYSCAKTLLY
jgi:hypothetical protein